MLTEVKILILDITKLDIMKLDFMELDILMQIIEVGLWTRILGRTNHFKVF